MGSFLFPESLKSTDHHLHDCGSHDAVGTPSEYAEYASQRGIKSIAITNHVELFDKTVGRYDVVIPRDIYRMESILKGVQEAREKYSDMEILFGIEVENNPPCYPQMEEILNHFDFDIVIGSVHIVNNIPISATYCKDFLRSKDPEWLYRSYYDEMAAFTEWGHFDILGHGDIIRRYMVEVYPDFTPLYPEDVLSSVFKKMASKKQGLEINTSGLFQAPKSTYPVMSFVELAKKNGVERFSLGSDAHKPSDIGRGFEAL
ncbi:MAG: histidinol-phosphatase HisJ family protein [Fibrobacteres bacterium]|nr:histidinol-phosphatase HisJ family protein [Fibrobacterota bacterium]